MKELERLAKEYLDSHYCQNCADREVEAAKNGFEAGFRTCCTSRNMSRSAESRRGH